jgi:hypothetical protein
MRAMKAHLNTGRTTDKGAAYYSQNTGVLTDIVAYRKAFDGVL